MASYDQVELHWTQTISEKYSILFWNFRIYLDITLPLTHILQISYRSKMAVFYLQFYLQEQKGEAF